MPALVPDLVVDLAVGPPELAQLRARDHALLRLGERSDARQPPSTIRLRSDAGFTGPRSQTNRRGLTSGTAGCCPVWPRAGVRGYPQADREPPIRLPQLSVESPVNPQTNRVGRSQLGVHRQLGGRLVDGEHQVAGDLAGLAEVVGGQLGGADQRLGAGDLDPGQLGAHRDLGLRLGAADPDQRGRDRVERSTGRRRPRRRGRSGSARGRGGSSPPATTTRPPR